MSGPSVEVPVSWLRELEAVLDQISKSGEVPLDLRFKAARFAGYAARAAREGSSEQAHQEEAAHV